MLLPPNLDGTKERTASSHGQTNVKVTGVRAGHRIEHIISVRTSFHASIVDQPAPFVKSAKLLFLHNCCFFTTEPPPLKPHSKPTKTKTETKRICFFRRFHCRPIYTSTPQKRYLKEAKMYSRLTITFHHSIVIFYAVWRTHFNNSALFNTHQLMR